MGGGVERAGDCAGGVVWGGGVVDVEGEGVEGEAGESEV